MYRFGEVDQDTFIASLTFDYMTGVSVRSFGLSYLSVVHSLLAVCDVRLTVVPLSRKTVPAAALIKLT